MNEIRKAAVLGAGVMGATIAAHLVNAGLDVVLLDLQIENGGKKVNLADLAVKQMKKAKPSPIFVSAWLSKIKTGNFDQNMDLLKDRDWVVEVVKEDIQIKRALYNNIQGFLSENVILTTNTSGIPISQLSETLPEDLQPRFFGTHFFNPPRYMKLLELIAGPNTNCDLFSGFTHFAETTLGKGVVLARDCPNFVANRIGVMGMMALMHTMMEDQYSIEEVDKIMGPLTGRPKSAVFRTADLVGLDTFVHVAENLYEAAPEDPKRDLFQPPKAVKDMVARGLLGNKTGGGFYKKTKDASGKRNILTIDLNTLNYREKEKVKLPSLELFKNIEDLGERMRKIAFSKDRVGQFVWKTTSETLIYAVNMIGEVADDIVNIDRAMRWGFNWEMGPFETWDMLGVENVVKRLDKEGREVPQMVRDMLASGITSFYDLTGVQPRFYNGTEMEDEPARPNVMVLKDLKKDPSRVVKKAAGASILDLGDGVACLEFHGKMNAIGADILGMTRAAVEIVERDFEGLVVGNQGDNFSAGANLALLFMEAQEGNFEDINLMVRQFQKSTSSLRYCTKPVVVAPFGMTLGGGCEFALHGDAVTASAETYMGLVEVGVGLVPGGGGVKEMLLRHVAAAHAAGEKNLLPVLQKTFETIGMAKVATSGEEARQMGFLRDTDSVIMNGDALIHHAKNRVLALAKQGYKPPEVPNQIPVLGEPAYAALKMGLYLMREGGYISEHDQKIGAHLARILTGGSLTPGQTMTEQHVLDLEREAFLRLCGERKTLERIHHMLTKGKPLRN